MEKLLPQFTAENPQLAVEQVLRRGSHPTLKAEYCTHFTRTTFCIILSACCTLGRASAAPPSHHTSWGQVRHIERCIRLPLLAKQRSRSCVARRVRIPPKMGSLHS